jgi:subtilisin family serine protease
MTFRTRALPVVIIALLAACRDSVGVNEVAGGHTATPPETAARTLATFDCDVVVHDAHVTCREPAPFGATAGDGPRLAILGGNHIKMTSANKTYDSIAEVMSFDATMQNLLTKPIGTPDGVIKEGSTVFFESGPTAYEWAAPGDTGTVSVKNADGYADYTRANQPYFRYDTILQPQQVSASKRWEYNVPRAVKRFRFSVKIFTSVPGEKRVPLTAPDTIPAGFYDTTNVMLNSPYFGLSRRALKDIVVIRYNADATREERQAAVDVIAGEVVGGQRMSPSMEGSYFVRINDDGTGRQMLKAVDTLSTLPSVATVKPEYMWLPSEFLAYVEPVDGSGYNSWKPNPNTAEGDNWALEAIAAPHAWACSVGSSSTKMAVVDVGYFSHPDLMPSVTHAPALDAYVGWRTFGDTHGHSVASVIAAKGNNQQGITGMMWNADLRLYDASVFDNGDENINWRWYRRGEPMPLDRLVQQRLHQAISAGADVVNMSLANPLKRDSVPQAKWDREVSIFANEFSHIIQSSPNKPLIVIAAGNQPDDAYWNQLPYLARLLPDQVIVVGGVTGTIGDHEAGMWARSARNTSQPGYRLIQIAAPAEGVGVLTPDGTANLNGTSFAAPLVAGIAGLLKSFDPRLTTAQIKELLLEGARRGGRRVFQPDGEIYLANAYQSLVTASERPGAPLCGGQPVYRDEEFGTVQTRRIVNGAATPLEQLFTQAGSTLVPLQGETTIRVDGYYYGWSSGGWSAYTQPRVDVYGNATNRSKLGRSHDGDSTVTVNRVEVSDTQLTHQVLINGELLAEVPATWAKKPAVKQCVRYPTAGSGCYAEVDTWHDRITAHTAVGYSPRGDEVVLAIWKQRSTYSVGIPYPCGAGSESCRDHTLEVTTLPSELVFIRIADGQIVARRTGPMREISSIGYSEDGQRLVLSTAFTFSYVANTTATNETTSSTNWYCQAQYMTRGGMNLATLPLKRQHAHCYGGATFSP